MILLIMSIKFFKAWSGFSCTCLKNFIHIISENAVNIITIFFGEYNDWQTSFYLYKDVNPNDGSAVQLWQKL